MSSALNNNNEADQGGVRTTKFSPTRLMPALVLTVLAVVGGIAALEAAKYWALPKLTWWESQAVTTAVLAGTSVWATYLALRRQFLLGELVVQQGAERKRTEAELQEVKGAAEDVIRAKAELLASMSHEVRTPLNGILGMTELALVTELSPEQRDCLEMVKTSADSLHTVINDILDYAAIEVGRLAIEHVEFNLRDTLGEAMQTLALWASQKNLELACDVRPEVPQEVVGDPARLQQIVLNLVGNAIKFTEQGEIVLEVGLESQAENGLSLLFTLTDTGVGTPVEQQRTIFAPFPHVDGSVTPSYGGGGIGLALSSRLVEMMGGRTWSDTEAGKGSAFYFSARFGLSQGPPKAALQEVGHLRGEAVLVVDDSAKNRRILQDMLVQWQMKPTLADSGRAALLALEYANENGEPFPLVILDAHLQDTSGFAVAERIKQDPQLAGATVIMMLQSADHRDIARCRELAIRARVVKPIKQSDLQQALLAAREKPQRRAEPHEAIIHPLAGEGHRKLRVLLAEDNLVNQKLIVSWLEKAGYTVVVADNGRKAIAALEKWGFAGFDVLLMDVQMPEMDGLVATALIREREKVTGTHLPIIAVTAHALKGDRERCLQAGMDGYIAKPARAKALSDAIERLVPGSAELDPAPETRHEEMAGWDEALARAGADKQVLADMMRLVRDESRKLLSAMRDAIARQDTKALEAAAHSLENTEGILLELGGFEPPQRSDGRARAGDLDREGETHPSLEEEFKRVRQALTNLGKGASR